MKLRNHKHSKLKKPNFYEKFLLTQNQAKRAQNGTICRFVRYNCTFLRIDSLVFLVFCMTLETSKPMQPNFLGKFLLVQKQAKKTRNVPIYLSSMVAFFSQDWLIRFVSYFAKSWGKSTQNRGSQVFLRKYSHCWKWDRITQNVLICLLVHYGKNSFCFHIFLQSAYF